MWLLFLFKLKTVNLWITLLYQALQKGRMSHICPATEKIPLVIPLVILGNTNGHNFSCIFCFPFPGPL